MYVQVCIIMQSFANYCCPDHLMIMTPLIIKIMANRNVVFNFLHLNKNEGGLLSKCTKPELYNYSYIYTVSQRIQKLVL